MWNVAIDLHDKFIAFGIGRSLSSTSMAPSGWISNGCDCCVVGYYVCVKELGVVAHATGLVVFVDDYASVRRL